MPTKSNPADLASRGSTVEELKKDTLWWGGPEFLKCLPEEWPERKVEKLDNDPERRKNVHIPYQGRE